MLWDMFGVRAGVLASSKALLLAAAAACSPSSSGPLLPISELELENPDHSLGAGWSVALFRLSISSNGPPIVRRLSACSDCVASFVSSRKLPLFFLLNMTATSMRTMLASMALIAIDAGSMVGLYEETTRPGGGASHTVGSELAAEDDIVRTVMLLMLYGGRKKVNLPAV